jgi:5-methyltetrahydropteroyltriglutamate--homocysteine methyltransferase
LDAILDAVPAERWLSLGLIDRRNTWRADLRASLGVLEMVAARRGNRHLMVAPSCSLLHVPVDLGQESGLDREVKSWLAFAEQKLAEVATLARGLDDGASAIAAQLAASDEAVRSRRSSDAVHRRDVQSRLAAVTPAMERRASPYQERRAAQ